MWSRESWRSPAQNLELAVCGARRLMVLSYPHELICTRAFVIWQMKGEDSVYSCVFLFFFFLLFMYLMFNIFQALRQGDGRQATAWVMGQDGIHPLFYFLGTGHERRKLKENCVIWAQAMLFQVQWRKEAWSHGRPWFPRGRSTLHLSGTLRNRGLGII